MSVIRSSIQSLALFAGTACLLAVPFESRKLSRSRDFLVDWADVKQPAASELAIYREKALHRAKIYEEYIEKQHLERGMVVNRTLHGETIDRCDSLLFSALRFVALKKLAFTKQASSSWESIEASKFAGQWLRHPLCKNWMSRDMYLGILLALSQKPPRFSGHLKDMLAIIRESGGYFDSGPIYLSYATPGVAEAIRKLSILHSIPISHLPDSVRAGFSTIEWDVLSERFGYQAHLIALRAWLDLEIDEHWTWRGSQRSILDSLSAGPLTQQPLGSQRLQWVARRLYQSNPSNLFFEALYLRSIQALTEQSRLSLLKKLLARQEFPETHLPLDCDRSADYLWQRSVSGSMPAKRCEKQFAGVDYLWALANILDEKPKQPLGF